MEPEPSHRSEILTPEAIEILRQSQSQKDLFALAQRQKLLTLGERTNGYGPLFERDWHEVASRAVSSDLPTPPAHRDPPGRAEAGATRNPAKNTEKALVRRTFYGLFSQFQIPIGT